MCSFGKGTLRRTPVTLESGGPLAARSWGRQLQLGGLVPELALAPVEEPVQSLAMNLQ